MLLPLAALAALDVCVDAVEHTADTQEIHDLAVFKQLVFKLLGDGLAVGLFFSGQQQQR